MTVRAFILVIFISGRVHDLFPWSTRVEFCDKCDSLLVLLVQLISPLLKFQGISVAKKGRLLL